MKLKRDLVWSLETYRAIRALLDYSMNDINNYNELTEKEKECISEELFNQIFVSDEL